ncbi:hypothetical protein DPSP01_010209 [Paraphaeosphaeria sporulosa]|uniref:EthD domain-containing protein n=1 Tax=Paraphaeosphaeria sporulosa TaxID=1460663 RepID=A0A177C8G0_9PLEO|nr:uncharacterized protein CC84DRAFT_1261758 [Paraphaeosphaeria sporulosa]OAG03139.1 hypothetical protein CC84DRAFT_1261758 [Paraphaeosphaeria sporulosa]
MPKGIIWVSSRLSHPPVDQAREGVPALTPERFCDWYENTHIQEVTALKGVPAAVRWEAAHPQPSPSAWSVAAPWLTIYEMPDISYRDTAEFKGLDGQSPPKDALLHEIFEQARFDTRFYEETFSSHGSESDSSTPLPKEGKYVLSLSTSEPEATARLFDGVRGVRRLRAFRVQAGTTLERFVRRDALGEGGIKGGLVVVEFGEGAGERVSEVVKGEEDGEVGWYVRKREYGEVQ